MLAYYISIIEDPKDEKLFEQLYINYRKQMFYLARSILSEDAAAEDAVHDVFVAIASKHMPTIQKIGSPTDLRNYLLKATKNCCLNYIQKRNKTPISTDEMQGTRQAIFEKEITDDEFLEYIYNLTEAGRVVAAIKALPGIYAETLYYHFVMGLTGKEIAKLTGNKLSTVKKQLVRGKAALLQVLNGRNKL